jgi:hypothetical protein
MKYAIQLTSLILISLVAFTLDISIGDEGVKGVEISMVSESYAAGWATPCTGTNTPAWCTPVSGTEESVWLKNAVDALNAILGFMTFLITPLIALAGWLLSPDWTRGDLFGLNIWLYKIWVTISNITYFLYALWLIGIALATIFNVENYTYKQLLPKLALGILIVPFTWWIVQAVLSVSNILTVAVMQIPRDTLETISGPNDKTTWYEKPSIPKTVTYDGTGKDGKTTTSADPGWCLDQNGNADPSKADKCLSPRVILTEASSWPYSMLTIYAYSVFKIQDYKRIDNVAQWITVLMQVFNKLIFGALIYLIFWLLIVALVFALLARAFELWILTMFSPLLSLSIVLPDSMKGDAFKDHISFSNLITLAMIPVYVSAALSFGILFLGLLMNGNWAKTTLGVDTTCGSGVNTICLFWSKDSFLKIDATKKIDSMNQWEMDARDIRLANSNPATITSTFALWKFELIHKWTITNEEANSIQSTTNFFSGSWGIIGTIILNIIGLTLLWLALMWALKASKITASAIEPFEKAGKSIGELGKSLPKYAPIPGTGISANSISRAAESAKYLPWKADEKRFEESKLWKVFGVGNNVSAVDAKKVQWYNQAIESWDKIAMRNATPLVMQNLERNPQNSDEIMNYYKAMAKWAWNNYATLKQNLEQSWWDKEVADKLARRLTTESSKWDLDFKSIKDKELYELMKKSRSNPSVSWNNDSININFWQKKVEGAENTFDIKIDWGEIQLKFDKDGTKIEKLDESELKTILQWKTWIISKKDFGSKLNLPIPIEKWLIEKIDKANPKFFKPDEPTSSATPPPSATPE